MAVTRFTKVEKREDAKMIQCLDVAVYQSPKSRTKKKRFTATQSQVISNRFYYFFTCKPIKKLNFFYGKRCPWCNGYRRRKWTRRYEFKSWTRLIAFHIALIPLGKVLIQLFFLQLPQPWWGHSEFKPVKLRLEIGVVLYPARAEELVNMERVSLFRFRFWLAIQSSHFIKVWLIKGPSPRLVWEWKTKENLWIGF